MVCLKHSAVKIDLAQRSARSEKQHGHNISTVSNVTVWYDNMCKKWMSKLNTLHTSRIWLTATFTCQISKSYDLVTISLDYVGNVFPMLQHQWLLLSSKLGRVEPPGKGQNYMGHKNALIIVIFLSRFICYIHLLLRSNNMKILTQKFKELEIWARPNLPDKMKPNLQRNKFMSSK